MKNQNNTPLFDALKGIRDKSMTHFDVPGHKRGQGLDEFREYFGHVMLECDVNAMKGLDFLSNPTDVIKEAEALLAECFGADESFLLVNGTSSGVHAMIMAACNPGDKIIMPRNAHKSAVNGMILSGAVPVYVKPIISDVHGMAMGVKTEDVIGAIEDNKDAKAVFIINPTYYGVTSDLERIVAVAHEHDMLVLVDEAHGAHFHFHNLLPASAMACGADMSAVSLHKTGGSLTQSSALLLNEGYLDRHTVMTILNLSRTTSASYLLMSSIDVARKQLAISGQMMLDQLLKKCNQARAEINSIPGLICFGKELNSVYDGFDYDLTKIGVNVNGIGLTGFEVYNMLRDEYNIQVELSDRCNILAIASLGDMGASIDVLVSALRDIAEKKSSTPLEIATLYDVKHATIISPRDAFYANKVSVDLDEAIGEISGESIMAYPPGIPIITPGEKITKEIIDYIKFLKGSKTLMTDAEDPEVNRINILSLY